MEWHHWIRHRSFYATAIIYTGTRIMTNITQVFLPLYLVLSLNAPKGMIASIPFTIFASSFLSTMACERLTHRMGSEKLTMLGSLIVLASSFGWGFIRPDIVHWAYLFAITAGFGIGLVGVSALGLICEMVGDDCESSAFVYGSMSFFDKITNGVVIMLVEGCVPDDLSAASYYRKVQVYVPSTAAIAAIILLTFILMTRPVRPVITSPCARLMRINSGVMANGLSSVPVMHDHSANSNVNENTPLLSRV
jgi:Na+/melibiose symporter-like transporter